LNYNIKSEIYKIINYLRKSRQDIEREKRTGEDTLSTQRKIMTKILDDLKIPYDQADEIGSGDKIETRPVFQRVLIDVEDEKYNAIAVKEIPRLGRGSYTDIGKIYDLIIEKRIFIVTPYKIYDPKNPADLRQIRFELFFAREEFEMIKERLISARYNLSLEGKWVAGRVPYGYKLNEKTTRLEPDEEIADIIRYIFTLYVYGLEMEDGIKKDISFRAISTHLSRLGILTATGKKNWNPLTVKRIVSNEVYIGTIKFRMTKRMGNKYIDRPKEDHIIVKNAHEPIIDKETWDLAQKKLSRRVSNNTPLDFSPCELAGLIRCVKCGKRMVRQYSVQHYKKKNGETSIYKKEFLWCVTIGCTFVKYRDVENRVIEILKYLQDVDIEKSKEFYNKYYNKVREEENNIDVSKVISKKRDELKKRLDFICDKYEQGIYDDDMFVKRKKEIEKEMNNLDKIYISNKNENSRQESINKWKKDINSVLKLYKVLNKTERNKLLHSVIDEIVLEKTSKGKFDLNVYPKFDLFQNM